MYMNLFRDFLKKTPLKVYTKLQNASSLLFFFAKLLHAKSKHASRDKRERNVTLWFAIALAEIGTKGILREKADCKQSRTARQMYRPLMSATYNLQPVKN